jgi:hypothetical protein
MHLCALLLGIGYGLDSNLETGYPDRDYLRLVIKFTVKYLYYYIIVLHYLYLLYNDNFNNEINVSAQPHHALYRVS